VRQLSIEKSFVVHHKRKIYILISFLLTLFMLILSMAIIFELSDLRWNEGLKLMFYYSYGSPAFLFETFLRSVPLLLISIGLIFPFIAGVWNIGAEGQFYIGAIMATATALLLGELPFPIPLIVATLSSCLGGALYALIPAFLRVKYDINELLTSLMLNFVAYYFLSYLLFGPLKNPMTQFPETSPIPLSSRAPALIPNTRFNILTILAFVIVPITYISLTRTKFAVLIRYMGANLEAALCMGININKLIYTTMALSGALAGFAGAHEVLGVLYALRMGISMNYGYVGIGLAYFGNLNPLGVFLVSLLAAGIINGTLMLSFFYNIPVGVYQVLLGAIPLFVIVSRRITCRVLNKSNLGI